MTKTKWKDNRIVGCESNNHSSCKGELWECERCHKKVCWEEGSTDLLELCDDCWVLMQPQEEDNAYKKYYLRNTNRQSFSK